jgi:hypothetical protein
MKATETIPNEVTRNQDGDILDSEGMDLEITAIDKRQRVRVLHDRVEELGQAAEAAVRIGASSPKLIDAVQRTAETEEKAALWDSFQHLDSNRDAYHQAAIDEDAIREGRLTESQERELWERQKEERSKAKRHLTDLFDKIFYEPKVVSASVRKEYVEEANYSVEVVTLGDPGKGGTFELMKYSRGYTAALYTVREYLHSTEEGIIEFRWGRDVAEVFSRMGVTKDAISDTEPHFTSLTQINRLLTALGKKAGLDLDTQA